MIDTLSGLNQQGYTCNADRLYVLRKEIGLLDQLRLSGYDTAATVGVEQFKTRFKQELAYLDCRK